MFLSVLIDAALACGGFVPTSGSVVSSDAQQALFDIGADGISVTYRARYDGDAADFAWVLAVPGPIAAVQEGDEALLDAIVEQSAPRIEVDPTIGEGGGGGCGCGGYGANSKGDALGGGRGDTGVVVTGSGFAGDYSYTTLRATEAAGLKTWLTDNGYDTTLIADAIDAYVASPLGFEFVAVQLRPEAAQTPDGGVDLDPLRIDYGRATDGALHALFPASLGRTSTVDSVRTELFVLATGTATLGGGWEAVTDAPATEEDAFDFVGPDYVAGEDVYTGALLGMGGEQRQMWLAYAGAYRTDAGERWLTRYDAITYPSANVVDPVFTDSGEATEADTVIYVMDETEFEDQYDTAWLLPLGILAGVGLRRRR